MTRYVNFLSDVSELRVQIERGDTYPMVDSFTPETFAPYFFGNFACIMVDNSSDKSEFWRQDHPADFWKKVVLGCFYVFCHFRITYNI
jgi:hypothetical protein